MELAVPYQTKGRKGKIRKLMSDAHMVLQHWCLWRNVLPVVYFHLRTYRISLVLACVRSASLENMNTVPPIKVLKNTRIQCRLLGDYFS